MTKNEMKLEISSKTSNKKILTNAIEAFIELLSPSSDTIRELNTALGEAFDNTSQWAYPHDFGKVNIFAKLKGNKLIVKIRDYGEGMKDIEHLNDPQTLGFIIIEKYMDSYSVSSTPKKGTVLTMHKTIK